MLSFEPCLLTAALVTLLFLWLRKICTLGMSLFLALTAAFGTILWQYAYIGLEPKQSFFLFLAGYLAQADGKIDRSPRLLLFGFSCGLASSLKTTRITLWPVIAYLIYFQFGDNWRARQTAITHGSGAYCRCRVATGTLADDSLFESWRRCLGLQAVDDRFSASILNQPRWYFRFS